MDDDGFSCYMEQHLNNSSDDHDGHDHDDDHDGKDHAFDDHDDKDHAFDDHDNTTNCSAIYKVCRDLILDIGLTTEACLAGNVSTTTGHDDDHDDDDDDDVSDSEGQKVLKYCLITNNYLILFVAYGYGFLSTVIISAASQLGVFSILFSYSSKGSKYIMSVLIAIGVSTLVSDAILHLIPHVMYLYVMYLHNKYNWCLLQRLL